MVHTQGDDSGAFPEVKPGDLQRKLEDLAADRDTQRELVDRLTAQLAELDKELVDARTELRMRAALAQEAADELNAPVPPTVLLHALHAPGQSGVWVDDLLVLVVGSVDSDERDERALYRYLRGDGEVAPQVPLCGFWVQHMPARMLGYVRDGRIVVNRALSRQERGRVRRELAAKVRAHRQSRRTGWRLTVLAPVALVVATLRSLLYGVRDVAANAASAVGPSLVTATAGATIVVTAVSSTHLPATFSPHGDGSRGVQRRGPVTVAQTGPLASAPAKVSPTPRPSSAKAADEEESAAPVDEDPTMPAPATPSVPAEQPTTAEVPPPSGQPAADPGPPVEMVPEPTPVVTTPTEPVPSESASQLAEVPSEPPADPAPATDPPADPEVPAVPEVEPQPEPEPAAPAAEPSTDPTGESGLEPDALPAHCPLGVLADGCTQS
ncbi:hypothetical protein ACRYCC_25965 [Actinomadura scrupuli]|uniref:hypothetical protein n=1 Tax=Actinomadura scrupuli TaxID=559629 RepID=UPI003D96E4A0